MIPTIYVPDVGDGLSAGLLRRDGAWTEIDCGSRRKPGIALKKSLDRMRPDAFFLSHFHSDHYNGLVWARNWRREPIAAVKEAFYPRLPAFSERATFLRYTLAMAHWLVGDKSGSAPADFLNILSSINRGQFTYRALSRGDRVTIGSSRYDVLWPPRFVDSDRTLKVIRQAIEASAAAMEEDEDFRRIVGKLGEDGEIEQRPYLEEEGEGDLPGSGEVTVDQAGEPARWREEMPEVIRRANRALRTAANHLSLAFHEENRILFMGDLERSEIKTTVADLVEQGRERFYTLITPHHGTHWHSDLSHIRVRLAISSAGRGLYRHVSPQFKRIAYRHLVTHLNGDVEVGVWMLPWEAAQRSPTSWFPC